MNESYTKTIESKNKLIKKNDIISALIFLSLLSTPAKMQATIQTTNQQLKNTIELNETNDLLDKMNQKFWITLPQQYNENLKNFISNSITLNHEAVAKFTEKFISEQMSQNRWISEENQYLFIRCAIYYILTNWELYDWSDWNGQRYNEYEIAFEYFLNCEENYKIGLKELIENEKQTAENDLQKSKDDLQKSKDDLQKSRDDLQKSRDDLQKSKDELQKSKDDLQKSKDDLQKSKDDLQKAQEDLLRTDSLWLIELIKFYDTYQKNPNLLSQQEFEQVSKASKDLIKFCKRDWINYKDILIKEIWDKRKVEQLLKFYWIE